MGDLVEPIPKQTSFGEEIGRRRVRLGWTQRATSKRMGLGLTTWESWERGTHTPNQLTQRLVLDELRRAEMALVDEILDEHDAT